MNRLRTLRAQLAFSAAALTFVVVALSGVAITIQMDHRDRSALDRELQARALLVSNDVETMLLATTTDDPTTSETTTDEFSRLLDTGNSIVRIISGAAVLAQRGYDPATDLAVPSQIGLSVVTVDGGEWRSLVIDATDDSNTRIQLLQNIAPLQDRLAANRRLVAAVTAIAAIVTGIAGWILAGLLTGPLERLRLGALAVRSNGKFADRLPVTRSPREIHDLALVMNGLLQQLQASSVTIRRFTADAGRELRTPLNRIGQQLESMRKIPQLAPTVNAMIAEQRRMGRLLEGMQLLARGDSGTVPAREFIDVVELVDYCVNQANHRYQRVSYCFDSFAGSSVIAEGWADGLRLAIDHLLQNAALHGKPDGTVEVELYAALDQIDIVVSDNGPGIPADEREPLKERFARGSHNHAEGAGLGLALVVQQAAIHGGRLTLEESPSGGLAAILNIKTFPFRTQSPARS